MKLVNYLLSYFLILSVSSSLFAQKSASASEGPFDQLIIRGVTLINGNGAPPIGPVDIVVEKNIIKKIKVVGYPGVPIDAENRPQLKSGLKIGLSSNPEEKS